MHAISYIVNIITTKGLSDYITYSRVSTFNYIFLFYTMLLQILRMHFFCYKVLYLVNW